MSSIFTVADSKFDFMQFLPIILIFVVFYFLVIRPQQKKMKEHRNMLSMISRGDKVITSGGIIGKINRIIDEKEVVIEIDEKVNIRVLRSAISEIVSDKNKAEEKSTSIVKK